MYAHPRKAASFRQTAKNISNHNVPGYSVTGVTETPKFMHSMKIVPAVPGNLAWAASESSEQPATPNHQRDGPGAGATDSETVTRQPRADDCVSVFSQAHFKSRKETFSSSVLARRARAQSVQSSFCILIGSARSAFSSAAACVPRTKSLACVSSSSGTSRTRGRGRR